jgi:putative heme-binding domain-containing protein
LMNLEAGRDLAALALADPSSMTLRKKAADLLAPMASDKKVEATLLATLPVAPAEIASTIAAGLARTDPGTEALLAVIESGKAAPALLRNKAVAAQLAARNVSLKNRAAMLTKDLPPEDARLDAVIAQRVETFRAGKPDAAKGSQIFAQQCAVCHRFRDIGGNVGPNLDGMAARGVHRLAEDILDPNRNVDPAFRQTVIETNDGQTVAGVNLRDKGNALALSDVTGKELTILKATIKTRTESRLSLMPPVYESLLTAEDFNDLLGYLLAPTK